MIDEKNITVVFVGDHAVGGTMDGCNRKCYSYMKAHAVNIGVKRVPPFNPLATYYKCLDMNDQEITYSFKAVPYFH